MLGGVRGIIADHSPHGFYFVMTQEVQGVFMRGRSY